MVFAHRFVQQHWRNLYNAAISNGKTNAEAIRIANALVHGVKNGNTGPQTSTRGK